MLNKFPPGVSSENLLSFRVALTCPGSNSGLQTSLPTQHIPLSPCIRVCCGQGCVHPFTFLISSWMSHLLILCSGTVLWDMRGHLIDLVLYQISWSNFEPESLVVFFSQIVRAPLFQGDRFPGLPITKIQGGDISWLLSRLHREHPLPSLVFSK